MMREQSPDRPAVPALSNLAEEPDLRDGVRRRHSVRRPVNVRVAIEGRTDSAWALNLSSGGVRILAEAKIRVGELLLLRLGDDPVYALSSKGRVVWVREEGEDVVAGIEFVREAA
jgi:hypothetical protein